jgi:OOP family OmpA-OmpF porin
LLKSDKEIKSVSIVGYADRIGSAAYNEKLSRKRAVSVKDYLAKQGYTNASVTKVRWVGKTKPSTNCAAGSPRASLIECLSPDRKVEVEVNYTKTTKTRKGAN